jgi:5-methylthioadenosine/S-adenosylhomocysteine deaminase
MPTPPIDPASQRYGLDGRVVTMNAAFEVIPRARVYVDAGRIVAVAPAGAPPPAGLEDVPVVRTGGTIYPGLIELHNHLSYNALPLWALTERFSNRGQWGGRPIYRQLVSRPAAILGGTDGLVQAVVRYVEVKCLVSGVTTTQGISLASNSGIRRFYKGVVRNVEQTDDPQLPEAATRIADLSAGDATSFLQKLRQEDSLLLLHLSEGVDESARRHFLALQIDPDEWAITGTLGGIHCCGLRDDDYATYAAHGGSMVWSPFSNLLLYGGTADFGRARREGVLMALGSDWSPTGSKNLLAEMKVARIVSEEAGGVFSDREIVAMATINAARMLKWDGALGSIEPGKRADLLVVDNQRGDPYDRLLDARETSVTLVVIEGVPRYGAAGLMSKFAGAVETLRVGQSARALNLKEAAADPIVGAVSLADAIERLADGLRRLPELDTTTRGGPGGARSVGAVGAGAVAASAAATRGARGDERWFLELDHAQSDGSLVRLKPPLGLGESRGDVSTMAAQPPMPLVSLELDPLTVVDDRRFAGLVAGQPNLPARLKRDLPRLYGK